ncbi:MAG: alpha/beta hydrolase [Proteobacteria bacterium]|nr:alpha/beta hydrolase [Pseudomonadota bacterium]
MMSTIPRQGVDIYYERTGSGPAIVFAHGAGGNGAVWWQQVPYFSERHTCLTFDHRSFGLSRCSEQDFRPAEFGNDLLAILDAEEIPSAHLVCQSMGGWTGVQLAVHHPERVDSLMLCNTFGGVNYHEAVAGLVAFAQRAGERDLSEFALGRTFIEKSKTFKYLYDRIGRFNGPREPGAAALLLSPEVLVDPEALKNITCPVMIMAASEDEIFPRRMLKGLAGLFPSAEFMEFEGIGHSVYFEYPEGFNRAVEAFVSRAG